MNKYNVLILGSGGREHTFAHQIKKSHLLNQLFIAPGNAGTKAEGLNIPLSDINDFEAIKSICLTSCIQLVIVGPEEPLVNGIKDFFLSDNQLQTIPIIGPNAYCAQLEGSKTFSKQFMQTYDIPTASFASFEQSESQKAIDFLTTMSPPYVIKADGLAAGKGVIITESLEEAKATIKAMMIDQKFGKASNKIVIESYLSGIELSVFVLCDGDHYKILPTAKDYKQIGDGDTGLNTGGMGAVSPPPFVDKSFLDKVENNIIRPTIDGIKKEGNSYEGFLFIGLMNVNNNPYVIEYNVRMGDPETEVVLPKLKTDLLSLLIHCSKKSLDKLSLKVCSDIFSTVVMVSKGYPESYKKGIPISLDKDIPYSTLFHAGTTYKEGKLVSNGGRVLTVTSQGKTIQESINKSYDSIKNINFENAYYRKDIGKDLINYNK